MNGTGRVGALAFASYLDAIGEDVDRLGQASEAGLGAAVQSCPGWSVAELLGHVTTVYERWSAQLAAGDPSRSAVAAPLDASPGTRDHLDDAAAALLRQLAELGPDAACWNFSGTDLVSGWVARRVALETAVHRVDAERAYGPSTPIETELAVDGIAERIEVLLPVVAARAPEVSLGGSTCLVCSDADASFVVDVSAGRVRSRRGRGPADTVLIGTASEIFLFSWGRLGPDVLAVTGRQDVARAWASLPG